jgi:hypothetical protein
MRKALLDALRDKYEADISASFATINIYLDNAVGIGEHPQHLEELDKLIDKIAQAEEKISALEHFYPQKDLIEEEK